MKIILIIPLIMIILCALIMSTNIKDSYFKTTKSYIRSVLFFRLKSTAIENIHLDNDSLRMKLSRIIEKLLETDKNLAYKIHIENLNEGKTVKITIGNDIKVPFYKINEVCKFTLKYKGNQPVIKS